MKESELQAGKTYVGRDGKRRKILRLGDLPASTLAYEVHPLRLDHAPAWSERQVGWLTRVGFARWAEREATPEEQAP